MSDFVDIGEVFLKAVKKQFRRWCDNHPDATQAERTEFLCRLHEGLGFKVDRSKGGINE